ncbi:hypothetical protein JL49_09100 [Pseudoalteromonas luteoviolacea]|nr:hypothetical protein JL49_09100 [Pseudoalteromonas luteoviolacea]
MVTDSLIEAAIKSAKSGAFFRDSLAPVPTSVIENTLIEQDCIESQYRSNNREAAAPKGADKARLVISRKSQTRDFSSENVTKKQLTEHQKVTQLNDLFSSSVARLTPEQRSEWLGIGDDECLDLETGEVRPKFIAEVEQNHFVSSVVSKPEREENAKSNKKSKLITPNYQRSAVHFQTRNWNDEYRIVCTQMTAPSDAPDSNTGQRITNGLTSRARGRIIDSGLYMQAVKGGYNAFLTVTLDEAARKKLDEKHYKKDKGGKAGQTIPPSYNSEGEKLVFEMAENEEIVADGRFTFVKYDFATIGEQLSPFLDKVGKMHKRGWIASNWPLPAPEHVHTDLMHNNERLYDWGIVECIETCEARAITNELMQVCKIECEQDAKKRPVFDYMWVAEAPRKVHETRMYPFGPNGEMVEIQSLGYQNYHAHMLMRWNVPRHHFEEWAEKIEGHWKKGMVHIERIKSPAAAASYMLKALGYMSSDSKGEQGEIRGNRYNISKYARAEAWESCATHESQHMYGLIQEHLQLLEAKRAKKRKVQSELKEVIALRERVSNQSFTEKRFTFLQKLTSKIEALTIKVQSMASELHGNFARGGVAKFSNDIEFKKFVDNAIVRGWRLKTVFGLDDHAEHREQQTTEENAVNNMLIKAQSLADESLDAVANFYSRFVRVEPYELERFDGMSLVTGDIWAT